jgi:Kae1-associated kinase Bud32
MFSALSNSDGMQSKIIAEGAEAKIYLIDFVNKKYILKERIPKAYRAKELDDVILSKRIKSEVRLLNLTKETGVKCPIVYYSDSKKIIMEYLPFVESKAIIKTNSKVLKQIANDVVKLHEKGIIHGDLTLCNVLYDKKKKMPYFIDFGLSFLSHKLEDKAMDLEVLREIIIADFSEKEWLIFEKEYAKQRPNVIKYMEKIQKRKKYL